MNDKLHSNRPELPALTGIRAIACFWVLLFHLQGEEKQFPKLHQICVNNWFFAPTLSGDLGVDLFFMLSGFILCYNYSGSEMLRGWKGYLNFLSTRLARIYPTHIACLFVMFVLAFVSIVVSKKKPEWADFGTLPQQITLVQAWAYPISMNWNGPAWSVSSEWLAYLCFPGYLFCLKSIKKSATSVVAIGFCLTCLFILCNLQRFPLSAAYGLIRIVFEFPIGCLLYKLYSQRTEAPFIKPDVWIGGGVIGVWIISAEFAHHMNTQIFCVPFLAGFIYALSFNKGLIARFMGTAFVRLLGRASYAIYMVQTPVYLMSLKITPYKSNIFLEALLCAASFLAAIGVGIIVHLYLEEPARVIWRKKSQTISKQWKIRTQTQQA